MISEQLTKGGNIPKYNSLIDLAVRIKDIPYIFEIKTIQRKNTRDQVRSGISQLYEYRYLQNLSNAKLVLVLQNQLPASVNWMADYLEKDRKINLIWDGDNKLFSNKRTRKELSFLWGK